MRVLVTGSRTWTDLDTIALVVNRFALQGVEFTLISGACPNGADRMVEDIWEARKVGPIERYPANWELHGKRAGFVRNAEMVKLGADFCIAFIKQKSKGATMTADLAEKAGIETWRFTSDH